MKASAYEPAPSNLKDPYSIHYNLTIDRELLPDLLLRVGYAGSHGVPWQRDVFVSPVLPMIKMPDGRLFFPGGGPRLNPNFATVEVRPYDGMSFYNALLLKVERRFKGGLRFQLSYTYSKSVDTSRICPPANRPEMDAQSRIPLTALPTEHFPTTMCGTTSPRTLIGNCPLVQINVGSRSHRRRETVGGRLEHQRHRVSRVR